MSQDLENIRRKLLGKHLYEKCEINGLSEAELQERLDMLKEKNCLTDCDIQDLIYACNLKTQPSARCSQQTTQKGECTSYFDEQINESCPICYEPVEEKEYIYIGKCGHAAHEECLEKWIDTIRRKGGNYTCPVCRGQVFRRLYEGKYAVRRDIENIGQNIVAERMRQANLRALEYQRQNPPVRRDVINVPLDESESEEDEFEDIILLENPSLIIESEDREIYRVKLDFNILTEGEEHLIGDFRRMVPQFFTQRMIDVFQREYPSHLDTMRRMWTETGLRGEVEEPTEENMRNIISRANRIDPSATFDRNNINVTFVDFVSKFILEYLMEDEENYNWISDYVGRLQNYENEETFMALILLFFPNFIEKLESESESESESDSESY